MRSGHSHCVATSNSIHRLTHLHPHPLQASLWRTITNPLSIPFFFWLVEDRIPVHNVSFCPFLLTIADIGGKWQRRDAEAIYSTNRTFIIKKKHPCPVGQSQLYPSSSMTVNAATHVFVLFSPILFYPCILSQ